MLNSQLKIVLKSNFKSNWSTFNLVSDCSEFEGDKMNKDSDVFKYFITDQNFINLKFIATMRLSFWCHQIVKRLSYGIKQIFIPQKDIGKLSNEIRICTEKLVNLITIMANHTVVIKHCYHFVEFYSRNNNYHEGKVILLFNYF